MVRMIPFRLCVGGGTLIPVEFSELPFIPKRIFWVSGLDQGGTRGNHAHRKCHQLIVAMAGSFKVTTEEGQTVDEFDLNDASHGTPSAAVYVPPLTWVTISEISQDAVIFVAASDEYDVADYIDDKDEYLRLWQASKTTFHHPV